MKLWSLIAGMKSAFLDILVQKKVTMILVIDFRGKNPISIQSWTKKTNKGPKLEYGLKC